MEQLKPPPQEKELPAPHEKLLRNPAFWERQGKAAKWLAIGSIIFFILLLISTLLLKPQKLTTTPIQPTQPPTSTIPTTTPIPSNPATNWKTYRNEKYGFEFKYPQDWIFEANQTSEKYDFLDIHLANFRHSDNPACDPSFMGLEIQAGLPKDQNQDFSSFVKSQQIVEGDLGPKGSLKKIKVDNHIGFKAQYSGWDSGCSGPGYFIEQDDARYIYIYTGADKNNQEEELEKFDQILSTFKFLNQNPK